MTTSSGRSRSSLPPPTPGEEPTGGPPDPGTAAPAGAGAPRGEATGEDAHADTTDMRRSSVRGSALLVVGRVLTLLLTTATQVLIVRALTKSEYGAFAYALALVGATRLLLSLGQGKLLSRFVAKYEEERDYARLVGSVALAVLTILMTSVAVVLTVFLLPSTLIGSAVPDQATVPIVLILVFLAPLEALDQVFISLFAAFSSPGAIFFRKYLFTPLLRLSVVLVLVVSGASITFLAVGYLSAGVVGLIVSVLVFVRILRERDLLRHLRVRMILPFRAVFSFSVPLLTGELFILSMNYGGVFILGYFHSAAEVANYRAVFSPAHLNTAVLAAFTPMFLPLAARLFARADLAGLRRSYWHTAAFVAVLSFPIFALTGPLATELTVVLFGERYADSGTVLALLAIGYYVNAVFGFNSFTLQVCQRIGYLVKVNVAVAVLNFALSLLLVQRLGAVGIAIANLTALVVQNMLNQWALRGALGTSFVDRSYVRCYLAIVVAAAGLWAFASLAEPGVLIGLLAAGVAWVFVLLVSRSAVELGQTFPELRRVPLLRKLIR